MDAVRERSAAGPSVGWWNRRNSPGSTHPPHRTLLPGDNLDTTHFAAGSLDETTYRCTLRYPKATEQPLALGVTVTPWEPARSPKWLHQGCPQRCDPATAVCGGVGTFHLPPAPCAVPCSPWGHRHPSSKGRRRLNPKGCWGSPHKAQCWGGISSALLRVTGDGGWGGCGCAGAGFFVPHGALLAKPEHRHTCTARWRGDTQSWGQSPGMAPSGHPGRGPMRWPWAATPGRCWPPTPRAASGPTPAASRARREPAALAGGTFPPCSAVPSSHQAFPSSILYSRSSA